jgi:hypothetical protein
MNSLEIAIHNLFQENASVDYVCRELFSKYEKNEFLSTNEIESLSHFFISVGQLEYLKKFYLKALRQNKINSLPLGFLAEMISQSDIPFSEKVIAFFEYHMKAKHEDQTIIQSDLLSLFFSEIPTLIKENKKKYDLHKQETKLKLFEQLEKNKLYQLHDQEKSVLDQLIRLYPNDLEVGILKQAYLERKADQILSRFTLKKNLVKPKLDEFNSHPESDEYKALKQIEFGLKTMVEKFEKESPDQLYNLSILSYQLAFFDLTLEILNKCPKTKARDWLKAEVLLDCGRHLDLLKQIESLESSADFAAEDTPGSIYLKALAYHGLGETDFAEKLLQSLAQAVPYYRSTEALLHEWTHK